MGNVKMRVWDVQHGNAIFIRTPANKHMIFDLGIGDYSEHRPFRSPLETLYHHYGVRTIDQLLITHPHLDHIDDILKLDELGLYIAVFHRPRWLDQNTIMQNVSDRDRPKFEKYFRISNSYNTAITTLTDPEVPVNNGGVQFEHFSTSHLPQNNLNNHSIITVVSYAGVKVIIPGDNEYDSLEYLMQRAEFLDAIEDCDVLIAPHHGRQSAYHQGFVARANPRITVVSDGSLCDTSANARYSANSRGWNIWKNGVQINRKCLTTNNDGEIYIDFGQDPGDANAYLKIEIKS
ncbi:ComEC/Rec2 family competence protein [Mucilaginibacter sp.]